MPRHADLGSPDACHAPRAAWRNVGTRGSRRGGTRPATAPRSTHRRRERCAHRRRVVGNRVEVGTRGGGVRGGARGGARPGGHRGGTGRMSSPWRDAPGPGGDAPGVPAQSATNACALWGHRGLLDSGRGATEAAARGGGRPPGGPWRSLGTPWRDGGRPRAVRPVNGGVGVRVARARSGTSRRAVDGREKCAARRGRRTGGVRPDARDCAVTARCLGARRDLGATDVARQPTGRRDCDGGLSGWRRTVPASSSVEVGGRHRPRRRCWEWTSGVDRCGHAALSARLSWGQCVGHYRQRGGVIDGLRPPSAGALGGRRR